MLYAYAGAAAVVGLLIGFVLLCVIWISGKVSDSIRMKTIDLVSAYDLLLETRSRELAEAEEKIKQYQTAPAADKLTADSLQVSRCAAPNGFILNAAERIGTAAYRDPAVGQTYQKIKGAFRTEPAAILQSLQKAAGKQVVGPATILLSELSYDTVYQLSALPGEEQSQILQESLNDNALALLNDYQAAHKTFSIIGFYDYLQAVSAMEPQPPRLRVSPFDKGVYPDGIEVIVDPDICEGFQIEFNNTLYDYCIKGRELS